MKKEQKEFEATTFNMWLDLKEKAKIYTAAYNKQAKQNKEPKINVGYLLNKALEDYLKDIQIED